MTRRLLAFVAIGSCFATVEEFLTVVVLRHDVASYVFTLLVLFPAFLLFAAGTGRLIDRLVSRAALREPVHFVTFGLVGLMIEWFLIGLTPWSNPAAPVVLMVLFQVGMFSFWATVAYAPRLLLGRDGPGRWARKAVVRFSLGYFSLVYVVAVAVPARLRFATVIPLLVLGYLVLDGLFVAHFARLLARDAGRSGAWSPPVRQPPASSSFEGCSWWVRPGV
jgi:hypothetical protein